MHGMTLHKVEHWLHYGPVSFIAKALHQSPSHSISIRFGDDTTTAPSQATSLEGVNPPGPKKQLPQSMHRALLEWELLRHVPRRRPLPYCPPRTAVE